MIETNPLVTVNILSFNRKDELRNTLTKVYEQDYKNIEVIVVDNASSDGSPEMVENEFPSVKLIKLQKNIGIAGWNKGFEAAKGEYILVLDDDSYPDNQTIFSGTSSMLTETNVGVVSFNVQNTRINKSETQDFLKTNPYLFNGCGALIKMEVVKMIGYYDDNFFIYLNELDFSIRIYNAGYELRYLENAIVFHNQSSVARRDKLQNPFLSSFKYSHYFLGYYIFLIKHFELKYFFRYSVKWVLNRLLICFKYPYLLTFLISIFKITLITPRVLKKRKVVSAKVQKHYNFGNTALIDRWYFPNFSYSNYSPKRTIRDQYYLIQSFFAFIVFKIFRFFFNKQHKYENRLLIINTGALGDVCISQRLIENNELINKYSKISFVTEHSYKELFHDIPKNVNIINWDKKIYKFNLLYRIAFIKKIRSLKSELCINVTSARGVSSDEISLLSGAPNVHCFANNWKTLKKPFSKQIEKEYQEVLFSNIFNEYERHNELLKLLTNNISNNFGPDSNSIFERDKYALFDEINLDSKYVVIAPMAHDKKRTWGIENYREFCTLTSKYIKIVLIGASREKEEAEKIKNGNQNIINLMGEIPLFELQVLICNSKLFLGNDSGLSHLAIRTKTPAIIIIGGGNFGRYFPYNDHKNRIFRYHEMDCFNCEWHCKFSTRYCLTRISVEDIYADAQRLMINFSENEDS